MRPNRSNNNGLDYALIVVACLLGSQLAFRGPLTPAIGYLALIAFVVSFLAFRRSAPIQIPTFGRFAPPARHWRRLAVAGLCLSVLVRWSVIVAGLLFVAFAFDVGALFSRNVMLTWFAITPVALCVASVRLS